MRTVKFPRGRWLALPIATLVLGAASPAPRTYDLRFGATDPVLNVPTSPVIARGQANANASDLAPTPNRDLSAPSGQASSNEASLAPGLFTRGRQNRGEGFLSGSSAQEGQDRRAMPGAGFNLRMPLNK